MNIKEKIAELTKEKERLYECIAAYKDNAKKLDALIKKLTKKASEVDELLDSTPIIDYIDEKK